MFKISDLTRRHIINLHDGAKLGPVKDVHIDPESGTIKALVLQGPKKFGFLSVGGDIVVPWEKIKKFGLDAVLVEVDHLHRI